MDDRSIPTRESDIVFQYENFQKRWANIAEIEAFASTVNGRWSWAAKPNLGLDKVKNVVSNLNNISERLKEKGKITEDERKSDCERRAQESFNVAVKQGLPVLLDDAVASWVMKCKTDFKEDVAASVLDQLMGGEINYTNTQHVFGAWLAHCYNENITPAKSSEVNLALEAINDEYRQKINELNSKARAVDEYVVTTKKLFERELALKAPVSYWNSRALWALGSTGVWGAALALFLFGFGRFLWGLIEEHLLATDAQQTGDTQNYHYVLILFLVVSGLGGYVVRILSKLFMGSLHLRQELLMRATMTQTFLSLVEREGALEPREKEIILKSIFLPVSSGFIKEDTGSFNPIDMVVETIKRT